MLKAVLAKADEEFPQHLEYLRAHIRQPSVSTERPAVDAMLARLTREIGALGGNVRVVETPELPVLFATIEAMAPRTVLSRY